MDEVVDQLVDRIDRRRPEAGHVAEAAALAELALLADDRRQALELLRHSLVALDDVVEHVGDASEHAVPFGGQPHGRIAALQRRQRAEDDGDLVCGRGVTFDNLHGAKLL